MNVTIRGNNVNVNESVQDYTQKKLSKLSRYLPNIAEIHVELGLQRSKRGEDMSIAQITLRHERGAILRAEEKRPGTDSEAYKATINLAVDKMYRQIDRFKGRRSDKKRKGGRYAATVEELNLAEDIPQGEYLDLVDEYNEYTDETEIVRRKQIDLNAMNEQEAISQMELLGHSFFMFMNGESGEINVLYRRSGGGYGVLVPQNGQIS